MTQINSNYTNLFEEIATLIERSKRHVLAKTNSTLITLFWQVGRKINQTILNNQRAGYGKQIVVTLSQQLTNKYGRNFEDKNLRRMMQFAEQYPDEQIVVSMSRHLSWSHILVLIPIKNKKAKQFYADKVGAEYWSVRELRKHISAKVFERTQLANSQLTEETTTTKDIFKDPYFLDFLGLTDDYLENDLEAAILRELEKFILELGKGFAFVERQKRMIIDNEDFYVDLLFYHRTLKRLVAIELKLGKFHAKDKGQMELYLKWLDRHERKEGELAPVGLILCA